MCTMNVRVLGSLQKISSPDLMNELSRVPTGSRDSNNNTGLRLETQTG